MNNVQQIDISEAMKVKYLDYSLSVIMGRALPDIRDGLKWVHRRTLYSMYQLGLLPDKGYRKSARIVGDVLGKYHPHGDSSVYDAMVRMAQDFSLRNVLIDGHGNWGSQDGDSTAHYRYTEAKLTKLSLEMIRDINKNTVDFIPNFDGEEQEPTILPSRFPNLLVNGSEGIAVGVATSIPPHNLGEVIDGIVYKLDNDNCSIEDLVKIIKAPDFPTKAEILNPNDMIDIYSNGYGKIVMRAKYHIETEDKQTSIIVTELPYQVIKSKLLETIYNLTIDTTKIVDKKEVVVKARIPEIDDIVDESDRNGMRINIKLKKNANINKVLSLLFKLSNLQCNYSANFNAIYGTNQLLEHVSLKDMINYYIEHQKEIITRRTKFDLEKSKDRLHILKGLLIAIDNMDLTIKLIRESKSKSEAREKLISNLSIDTKQSEAILELKLHKLTSLETDIIYREHDELLKTIDYLNSILDNESELIKVLKTELLDIKTKYGDERRTKLVYEDIIEEVTKEDMIENYSVTMVLTECQYLKKTLRYSETQKLKDGDKVLQLVQTNNKNDLLLFTNKGRVFTRKIYELTGTIECTAGGGYGEYIPNLLKEYLEKGEKIIYIVSPEDYDKGDMLYVFEDNNIARVSLSAYQTKTNRQVPQDAYYTGKKLIHIQYITNDIDILYITKEGKILITNTSDLNSMGTGGRKSEGKLSLIKVNTDKYEDNCIIKTLFNINKDDEFLVKTSKKDIEFYLQDQYDSTRTNYEYYKGNSRSQGNFIYNCRQKNDYITDIIRLEN